MTFSETLKAARIEAIKSVMGRYGRSLTSAYIVGTEVPPEFYDEIIAADPLEQIAVELVEGFGTYR